MGCGIILVMKNAVLTQSDDAKALYEIVKKQELTLVKLQEENSTLKQENKQLEFKAEHLELQLRKALQQRFGRKADKVPANQLSIFDEAEITVPADELEIENAGITVPEHQRKKTWP